MLPTETFTQSNEFLKNVNKDLRFKPIQLIFEKLFLENGFTFGNKFDGSVWFLKKKPLINNELDAEANMSKIINSLITEKKEEYSHLSHFSPYRQHEREGNSNQIEQKEKEEKENKTRNNETELNQSSKFKIYTCDFIKRITEILIYSQLVIDRVSDNLESHKVYEKINLLKASINSIQSKMEIDNKLKGKTKEKSSISFSLHKLNNFPEGEFNFTLEVSEFDHDFNIRVYEKKLISNKVIKVYSPNRKISLYQEFLRKDLIYPDIYLYTIDQDLLYEHMLKNIIYIKKSHSQTFLNSNSSNLLHSKTKPNGNIPNIANVVNTNENKDQIIRGNTKEKTLSAAILNNKINLIESNSKIKYIKSNFKYEENSGLNLIGFKILIDQNGTFLGEAEESFLEYLILHIDEFSLLSKNEFNSYYPCYVKRIKEKKKEELMTSSNNLFSSSTKKTKSSMKQSDYEKYAGDNEYIMKTNNEVKVVLNIQSFFTDDTKISMINRVISIFNHEMSIKKYNEDVIDYILQGYFPEVSVKIKKILQENDLNTRCCNTNDCIII